MADSANHAIRPVILSGGGGTRLWPLSRVGAPKQFLSITEEDSLFQATARRCTGDPFLQPLIVTAEQQRFFVLEQLEDAGVESGAILLEPAPRNTAAAVALAALWSIARGDDLILVMPSDQVIQEVPLLRESVMAATPAALEGAIVTFGVKPSSASSNYGYIKAGAADEDGGTRKIEQFVEKPDAASAAGLLEDPAWLWNSGIFLMRPSVIVEELERHAPTIAGPVQESMRNPEIDTFFLRPDSSTFLDSASDSLDYAVMERTDKARVLPVDFGWSDVGTWDSIWQVLPHDADGNVVRGDAVTLDVRNSLIRCDADMTVAAVGLSDIACIITDDAAFIAPLSRVQDSKAIVAMLRASGNPRADEPARVYRPWGTYQTVDRGDGFQTRRVIVKPGAEQSLQIHRHRSEHFVVVSGQAEISLDGEARRVRESESIFVPAGVPHRIRNIGPDPLHVIEVQSGSSLTEDDIERLEDAYGRAKVPPDSDGGPSD